MSDNIFQNVSIQGEGNIVVGKGNVIINPLPPAEVRLRHNLGILLKNVESTWIRGVLERSLHEAAVLELGMELREEAVDNPWRMVIEGPDQSREPIPAGRRIRDIYEDAHHLLLILGEPGSGKTTTLLHLARDLIAEVDQDFTQPVPVVLNLSTWTNKQQPLDEWLVAELNSKYRLPRRDGQKWLKHRRILPLLDGLDEVKLENRAACVEKINRLVVDYGLQGLVVCSRMKDYTDLGIRLAFYRAVYLQPLTPEQVDEYLDQAGNKLASLRAALQADEALKNLARSPLILNIMSLAYQNTSAEDFSDPALVTDKARRRHLFDTYIDRMFRRKAGARLYDDQQTRRGLSWFARNMQGHNQEVFLIEGLQPSWLSTRRRQWVYFLVSRLVIGLVLLWGLTVVVGVEIWKLATFALVSGLAIGFIDSWRIEWLRKQRRLRNTATAWWTLINVVAVILIVSLVVALIAGAILGPFAGPSYALFYGLVFGLPLGLRGSRQTSETDIKTVEVLRWSWLRAATGGLIGVIAGLLVGGLLSTSARGFEGVLELFFCQFFGFIGAILNGLRIEIIETKSAPNQGVWLSIRNAIFGGLIFGLIGGVSLLWMASLGSVDDASLDLHRLMVLLRNGLSFGVLGALWYGGFDFIQHYTLRLILILEGFTPGNFTRFLDYAVARIFLQKVGGGYRFIHRLLLEHFAEMAEPGL